jgi:hypothetical protein
MTTISFSVDQATKDDLDRLAELERRSKSDIFREMYNDKSAPQPSGGDPGSYGALVAGLFGVVFPHLRPDRPLDNERLLKPWNEVLKAFVAAPGCA